MRFYFIRGKQHLDLSGNIVLSNNPNLIEAKAQSAAPKVHNGKYIMLRDLTTRQKLRATMRVLEFIWGRK